MLVAVALGWCLLAFARGGQDHGEIGVIGVDSGPDAAFVALALGAPAAGVAAWWLLRRGALRPWPTRLGLLALGGLAVWSAASIAWAAAPDLAWLDANRLLLSLSALVLGIALAATFRASGAALGVALSAACLPVVVWALLTRILPEVAGHDGELARLSEPLDYWNALGLLVAMALPGVMWLSTRPRAALWHRALLAAWATILATTLLLTYSRGGVLAALVAILLTLWLVRPRARALAGLVAGAIGAVLPLAYGLTTDALTTDGLLASERKGAGIGLGWRLAIGCAVAAALVVTIHEVGERVPARALRRLGVSLAAAAALTLGATAAVSHDSAGGWIGDRVDELTDDAGVGNDPSRFVSGSLNQRVDWGAEAVRGFREAPLIGHGAGGFRLTHLAEREEVALRNEQIRDAHQLTLETASELGGVGVLLLVLIVGAGAWGAVRARRHGGDATVGLAIAIAGAFLVHTELDWSWNMPALAVPAFGALGAILGAAGRDREVTGSEPSAWQAVALALAAMVAVASAFLPWAAAREVAAGYGGDAASHAAAARSLNPLSIAPHELEVIFFGETDPARARRAARRAVDLQPDNPASWRLILAAGSGAEIVEARKRLSELDPLGKLR